MRRFKDGLLWSCLALACGTHAWAAAPVAEIPVVAQDLKALRAPGKIIAALWTRRPDNMTLQLVMGIPNSGIARASRVSQPAGTVPHARPEIQVWLLRADGSHIPWAARYETPVSARPCMRCSGPEVQYTYSLSESREAVAAAISVDGVYYIQQLAAFEG